MSIQPGLEVNLLFGFLYTSELAPTAEVRDVADIIRRSRSYNRNNGVTGILIFDGLRFCQYLEGQRDVVLTLARTIQTDARHRLFKVLHQGYSADRRFGEWSMGYALDTRGILLEAIASAEESNVIPTLLQGLPSLEIQPASP
jgi:hypothetical protein